MWGSLPLRGPCSGLLLPGRRLPEVPESQAHPALCLGSSRRAETEVACPPSLPGSSQPPAAGELAGSGVRTSSSLWPCRGQGHVFCR